MKTITIDLTSFCLGLLAMGTVLLMAHKPAPQPTAQPDPRPTYGRYQVVIAKDTRTIIIDSETGRFLVERPALGLPGWAPYSFEELYKGK